MCSKTPYFAVSHKDYDEQTLNAWIQPPEHAHGLYLL